ncbi:MAG: cytochrome c class, partial [Candidatus Solibacter sp.]|nr:cytochrome c class [Candidatus Solibacter sp.]
MCHFAVATWPTMACMITLRFAALLACGTLLLGQPPKAAPSFSPELVKSGESLFLQQCAFCHGRDTGGGEDGPDLTRSKLVAEDVNGSQIGPVVRNGREKMPRFTVTDQELAALVAYIRTRKTIAESQKGGRKGVDAADLATGNIDKGKAYFNGVGKCNSCHSPTGDLAGTATRNNGLKLFQRLMYPAGAKAKLAVTLPSGEIVTGTRAYDVEFTVDLRDSAGRYRSWSASKVKVKVVDPAE